MGVKLIAPYFSPFPQPFAFRALASLLVFSYSKSLVSDFKTQRNL